MEGDTIIRPRPVWDFVSRPDVLQPVARFHHAHSMSPARIVLPDLTIGASFLRQWDINQRPASHDWRDGAYDCVAPATFVIRDAIIHSAAGIVCVDNAVIAETLDHTIPDHQGYRVEGGAIALLAEKRTRLAGTHVSVLGGNPTNYYHALFAGPARLEAVPQQILQRAHSILYPAGAPAQLFCLGAMALPKTISLRPVADRETLVVEKLVLPWTVCGAADYHPCVRDFFRRVSSGIAGSARALPRHIYIDRRGAALRPLLNEDEVVDALRPFGFVPIRPETLSMEDQLRLFRHADAIVAPHGAGLANLGFCKPGTVILELFMDAYVNWCFRRLAAVCGLSYDCVLGRATQRWTQGSADAHRVSWRISPPHVTAAIAHMLS
jgi:hypothetical protein